MEGFLETLSGKDRRISVQHWGYGDWEISYSVIAKPSKIELSVSGSTLAEALDALKEAVYNVAFKGVPEVAAPRLEHKPEAQY